MLQVVLFAFYFLVLAFGLRILVKRSRAEISVRTTVLIFSCKVLLGCLYGYIFLTYYGGDDTWMFYRDSLTEYEKLQQHPLVFFTDFLPGPYFDQANGFVQGMRAYMESLESLLMLKLLALFNIFSRGNYYIDVLFFEFLLFWGPLLLYKLLAIDFPEKKKVLLLVVFFIPSIGFWVSGIRAEGLLLVFIGITLYFTQRWFSRMRLSYLVLAMAGMAGFMIFRGQSFLVFLPAFFCWTISMKKPSRSIRYFSTVYLICFCIFLVSLLGGGASSLAAPIIKRQAEFIQLHAKTRLPLDTLQPTAFSFLRIFPQAFQNGLIRPFPWEAKGMLQVLAAAEVLGFCIVVCLLAIYPERKTKLILTRPILLLFLFYGLSQILLIGYTVPFPGAIVRYKAIPELLLLVAFSLSIDWGRIFRVFKLK